MTIYFVGGYDCYEEHARGLGFERTQLGRDIILATATHALKGRVWHEGDVVTVCNHCYVAADEGHLHRYKHILDQLERLQVYPETGTSWRKIGHQSRAERGH